MSCPWPGWPRPPEVDWLLVTSLESQPGGGFTAQHLHRHELQAHGGDVLVRVAAGAGSPGPPEVCAQVRAVMEGRLVLAGSGDRQSPDDWAGQVRPAVSFAMRMITELEESGADPGPLPLVWLDDPDAATVRGAVRHHVRPGGGAGPAGGLTPGRLRSRRAGARTACPRCRCPGIPPATPASAGRDCIIAPALTRPGPPAGPVRHARACRARAEIPCA